MYSDLGQQAPLRFAIERRSRRSGAKEQGARTSARPCHPPGSILLNIRREVHCSLRLPCGSGLPRDRTRSPSHPLRTRRSALPSRLFLHCYRVCTGAPGHLPPTADPAQGMPGGAAVHSLSGVSSGAVLHRNVRQIHCLPPAGPPAHTGPPHQQTSSSFSANARDRYHRNGGLKSFECPQYTVLAVFPHGECRATLVGQVPSVTDRKRAGAKASPELRKSVESRS